MPQSLHSLKLQRVSTHDPPMQDVGTNPRGCPNMQALTHKRRSGVVTPPARPASVVRTSTGVPSICADIMSQSAAASRSHCGQRKHGEDNVRLKGENAHSGRGPGLLGGCRIWQRGEHLIMMDYPNLEKPNNAIFQFAESWGTFPGSFQQIKGSYADYFRLNSIYKSQNVP